VTVTRESRRIDALELGREFARALSAACGVIVPKVTLFGSRARGAAAPDSDLDLFVEIPSRDQGGTVERIARDIAYEMTLRHGIAVAVIVADRDFMQQHRGYSLLEAMAAEGICR